MKDWVKTLITNTAIYGTILGSVAYCAVHANERDRVEREAAAQAKAEHKRVMAQRRAVAILPAGVQAKWEGYVDDRFAKSVERRGGLIRLGEGQFVSANMPYQIECLRDSIEVAFGTRSVVNEDGDEVEDGGLTSVTIIAIGPPGGLYDFEPKAAAELGVPLESIAADRLFEGLCDRVASKMDRLTQGTRPAPR